MSAAVTEAFIQLHDKGLIYRGSYLVNWSPNLQTAVSDLEVDYSEEAGTLYLFKYVLADDESGQEFIPVATTRPETILGDSAVCVHPQDERFRRFVGRQVRVPMTGRVVPVIADEYVDRDFGTGALKVTPAHDVNDYEIGKRHQLPLINMLNKDATVNEAGGQRYAGLDRFVCRQRIWEDMQQAGLALEQRPHVQRVPRSQRGGEIIEPLVSAQWFVKADGMASKAVAAVTDGQLRILPERFEKVWFNWLTNIHDWCISRQLWWGHRIPVYYISLGPGPEEAGYVVARSQQEAEQLARDRHGQDAQLTVQQDEDVLDTWFSSGLWPFATVGWPGPSPAASDLARFYPAAVLETGYDILFFWVARMVMMGLELTGQTPFHTVYMHGLVRDGQGRKMSKTTGNVLDPLDTVDQFGCDALRYALVTGSTPGQDIPLALDKVEAARNFCNKLWNAGKFVDNCLAGLTAADRAALAVAPRDWTPADLAALPLPARAILSRCHQLVDTVTAALEQLQFGDAGRQVQEFLWDEFADWFIEASKPRIKAEDLLGRGDTRKVLLYVWETCLKLLHPFMPFLTESLWQLLPHTAGAADSIMVSQWPLPYSKGAPQAGLPVDLEALRLFGSFQAAVRAVRNARSEYNVDAGKKITVLLKLDKEDFRKAMQDELAVGERW